MNSKEKLTLHETWLYCMKMWKWVINELSIRKDVHPRDLKGEWINRFYRKNDKIRHNCFFCQYVVNFIGKDVYDKWEDCNYCPGRLIDSEFHCELYREPDNKQDNKYYIHAFNEYYWIAQPEEFYKKLQKMHEEYQEFLSSCESKEECEMRLQLKQAWNIKKELIPRYI